MSVLNLDKPASLLARIVERVDDHVNPIVVKELRQAVQGRFVSGVLMLFLAVALISIGSSLLGYSDYGVDPERGKDAFFVMYMVLLGTCMLFIPALAAIRMAAERSGENTDLLYVTTLTAGAIVRGKVASAMVLTIVIFSVCMPFMTLTYLLRGIDLATIVTLMALALLAMLTSIVFAVLLAALPGSRPQQGMVGLIGAFGLFVLFMGMGGIADEFIRWGLATQMGPALYWGMTATILGLAVPVLGLMASCAQACIMPPSANRALAIRIWVTLTWGLGLVAAMLWTWCTGFGEVLAYCWMTWAVPLLCLTMLGSVSEREETGVRLARSIPRSPVFRPLAFLFYSSAGGGVVWCLLLMLASVVLPWLAYETLAVRRHTYGGDEVIYVICVMGGIALYVVCYALTAVLIRRTWLARWLKTDRTWALALGIFAVLAVGPVLINLILYQDMYRTSSDMWVFLGTPFLLGEVRNEYQAYSLTFAALWAAVALMMLLPWIVRQMSEFRPPEPSAPEPSPQVLEVAVKTDGFDLKVGPDE